MEKTVDLSRWFSVELQVDEHDMLACRQGLVDAIEQAGFPCPEMKDFDLRVSLRSIWGRRGRAFFVNLLPFGRHLPKGKRFLLTAMLYDEHPVRIRIRIKAFQDWLLDDTEIPGVTQTFFERITDEQQAAVLMHHILQDLQQSLGVVPPEYFQGFDKDKLFDEFLEGNMLYSLESENYPRIIHRTDQPGPKWIWGAFILPEAWFLWHELRAYSSLIIFPYIAPMLVLGRHAKYPLFLKLILLVYAVVMRICCARSAGKIYYKRYGRFPTQTNPFMVRDGSPALNAGPSWCWAAFLVPELWLLWNGWFGLGVAMLAAYPALFEIIAYFDILWPPILFKAALALAVATRIGTGIFALALYRSAHGQVFTGKTLQQLRLAAKIRSKRGLDWSWPAFLLPEFWYLWNNIYNIGLVILLAVPALFIAFSIFAPGSFAVFWVITLICFVALRFYSGFFAHRLYYVTHGRWPGR